MSTLRQEVKILIDKLPESALIALKPLLAFLAEEEKAEGHESILAEK